MAVIECLLLAVGDRFRLPCNGGDMTTQENFLTAPGNLAFTNEQEQTEQELIDTLALEIETEIEAERQFLAELNQEKTPGQKKKNGTSLKSPEGKAPELPTSKVYSCREYLAIAHQNTTPLIGKDGDELLVRGEGMTVAGEGGIGKTHFLNALACNLCTGESFLKWPIPKPLRVIMYQAELPAAYFQKRLQPLLDVYTLGDPHKAELINENLFIADMDRPFNISGDEPDVTGASTAFSTILPDIERLKIDVVIIDPFLSFFRGNENDNCEVRRALDNIKNEVAKKCQCALIIADHMPKYAGSNKNPEQAFSMRGASAKKDWAASIIALTKMGTPDGQHGTFIKATVDKMRYGKCPKNPFNLRRDDFSFRHDLIRTNDIPVEQVGKVLDDAGDNLPKSKFTDAIMSSLEVSFHDARELIEAAIEQGWIVTEPGKGKALVHKLTDKYMVWRDGE
jgi:hypothetical protein